jgi:hypothetical protein
MEMEQEWIDRLRKLVACEKWYPVRGMVDIDGV